MAAVRLYRCVTMDEARRVLEGGGFVDVTDSFGTDREFRGVWLTDAPDELAISGATTSFEVVLTVEGLDEDELAEFKWVYEPNSYREWLVPAALLNERCTVDVDVDNQT